LTKIKNKQTKTNSVIHREPGLKKLIFNKLRLLSKMVRVFPSRRAGVKPGFPAKNKQKQTNKNKQKQTKTKQTNNKLKQTN